MISHLIRRAALGLAACAMIGLSAGSAVAQSPVDVTGPITDPGGVLGASTAEVRTALDDYFDKTDRQLFVVFVPTFDGLSGPDWADQSAEISDLSDQDILLAIATDERSYGYSIADTQQLSDSDLQRVEREDILPRLREEDWAGAAIGAASGYSAAAEGSRFPWIPVGLGGAALVGVGAWVAHRKSHPADASGDIDKECAAALVSVDNTLTTAEQELGFAEAQFGREATEPFRRVLAETRSTTQSAFSLRQQLDDAEPENPGEHHRIVTEIITMCTAAEATIAEQVEGFNTLRDLHANAPQVLADIPARAAEVTARLPASQAVLDRLRADHAATALASVDGNVAQAEHLTNEAVHEAYLGTAALAAEDRATAVVHAQAGQKAVSQATTLLDALDHADTDIAAAPGRIAERLTSIGQDLADVDRLAASEPAVDAAATTARRAVGYAQGPQRDPLAVVAQLQTAEAELDEVLAPIRAAAAEADKARVALADSLGRVTSRVKAVSGYIDTRRGAVGADARTRLSEAARHLDRAQQLMQPDPRGSLEALKQAEQHVDDAERRAQADIREWEALQRRDSRGGASGAILGGIASSRSSSSSRTRTTSRSRSRTTSRSTSRGKRSGGGRF